MEIDTAIKFNHKKVYRIIDRSLYSAKTGQPLDAQEYQMEIENVIEENLIQLSWRVVIKNGLVCLEA